LSSGTPLLNPVQRTPLREGQNAIIIGADRVVATTRAATFIVHRFIACALAATAFCFL
jgi:hypothetical protein